MSKQEHARPNAVEPSTEQLTEHDNPENQRANTAPAENNEEASGSESGEAGE